MNKTEPPFDPNGPGLNGRLFGLPYTVEEADVVVFPVPWEATVSHRTGTATCIDPVFEASRQIDLFDPDIAQVWKTKIGWMPPPDGLLSESCRLRHLIEADLLPHTPEYRLLAGQVNQACEQLNLFVEKKTWQFLTEGKQVVLLGGDHSTPVGYWRALQKKYRSFGLLHLDAHADLRKAYEGFTYSHGSAIYHAWRMEGIKKIVQVGIRDYCDEEAERIKNTGGRIAPFYANALHEQQFEGKTWTEQVNAIVDELPQEVHVSLDVDVLEPDLCPNTGTPVPGGLRVEQVRYLIKQVVLSGRRLIGADLVETGNGPTDAAVAARLLFLLCTWMPYSLRRTKNKFP